MLFHEIYSSYYNAVARILKRAVSEPVTGKDIYDIVRREAFSESIVSIPEALQNESWPLLTRDGKTPLCHAPAMPLTTLQKRWLKSLLEDPRIGLFSPSGEGLENVEALYSPDTFVYFDRYEDGDPYEDPKYQERFQTILRALREKRKVWVRFVGNRGKEHCWTCIPQRLEYSPKDDKFRVVILTKRDTISLNLKRIIQCEIRGPYREDEYVPKERCKRTLVFEITDKRNALERAMLHFSPLEKEVRRLDAEHYHVTLRYYAEDETELLIRILSFGPLLKVIAPDSFVEQIKNRIQKQRQLRA